MDKQEMLNLAAGAKLALNEAEAQRMAEYLGFTLPALEKMGEVDTTGVPPLIHCVEESNVFRKDTVSKTLSREEILANAPQVSDGCFKVPKVVD